MNLRIQYLTRPTPDFIALVALLDEELHSKNGELQETYDQYNTLNRISDFFIAYHDQIPVGIAAMKRYDDAAYEVKRVFVKKEYRGNGVAKLLMKKLEEKAAEQNIQSLILETSNILVAAVNLYRGLGYQVIENFGQYAGMPASVCLRKAIQAEPPLTIFE